MKKIISFFAACLVALSALVSCEQDTYLYQPTNECLTFSANSGAWLFTDEIIVR